MRRFFTICFLSSILLFGIVDSTPAHAATKVEGPVSKIHLTNPIENTDIRVIIGLLVKQALTILGSIALVVMLVGGAYWLTSAGNSERVSKGTQTMTSAAIGLFVIFGAYGILSAVIGGLTGKPLVENTGSSTGSGDTATEVAVYYKAITSTNDIVFRKEPKSTATHTLSSEKSCIKGTGKKENGFYEVIITNASSDAGTTAWVQDTDVEKNSDGCGVGAAAVGSGDKKTTCELQKGETHSCVDTTEWTKKQKENCISNMCQNKILVSQNKIEKASEGNSWLCCKQE